MKAKPIHEDNRFYVYGHFTKDTDELFYIGKGSGYRAWAESGRSVAWSKLANKGHIVKLLHESLKEDDALELEANLINSEKKINPTLINKRTTNNRIEFEYDLVNSLFYYDESSPSYLSRKSDLISSNNKVSRHKGTQVGWYTKKGYFTEIKGQGIQVHRLVYLLHHGQMNPRLQIDHINGNPLDNRIENLREVTASVNVKNRVMRNETGFAFIHFKESKRNGKIAHNYYLKFDIKGKRVTIHFPLSDYESKEAALKACLDYRESIRDVLNLLGVPDRVLDHGL